MHKASNERPFRVRRSRPTRPLVLALTLSLFAGSACAQWHVVDEVAISTSEKGFASQLAKTIEQYSTQLKEYATQLQQYQQMLSSIQGLTTGMSLKPSQLERVTNVDSIIQGKCTGTGGGGLVTGLMNSMASLMTQSISQTQQTLCAQIVTQQIDKYNKTVDMLNRLHDYSDTFQKVENVARAVESMADSNRASTQVEQYSSAVQTEMAHWQAEMNVADSVIATLQAQQSILGHIALKGSNRTLGNVVQAAAFAKAFH